MFCSHLWSSSAGFGEARKQTPRGIYFAEGHSAGAGARTQLLLQGRGLTFRTQVLLGGGCRSPWSARRGAEVDKHAQCVGPPGQLEVSVPKIGIHGEEAWGWAFCAHSPKKTDEYRRDTLTAE